MAKIIIIRLLSVIYNQFSYFRKFGFGDFASQMTKEMTTQKPGQKSGGGWQSKLKSKMSSMSKKRMEHQPTSSNFCNDLVYVVSSQTNLATGAQRDPRVLIPTQRQNHTVNLFQESTLILFGGHGGSGYSRKQFNDVWLLNLDNNRWSNLICQGNPPAPRSGHSQFCKGESLYIFGGWNNESQFNDFFMLDVENKDWSEMMELSWEIPRWNHSMILVEQERWSEFKGRGDEEQTPVQSDHTVILPTFLIEMRSKKEGGWVGVTSHPYLFLSIQAIFLIFLVIMYSQKSNVT